MTRERLHVWPSVGPDPAVPQGSAVGEAQMHQGATDLFLQAEIGKLTGRPISQTNIMGPVLSGSWSRYENTGSFCGVCVPQYLMYSFVFYSNIVLLRTILTLRAVLLLHS